MINGCARFSGECDEARPFCGSVCCKNTIVFLTEEEEKSGKYDYTNATEGCNCSTCQLIRSRGRPTLRRREDGCIYLSGENKCSIYENRPSQCKNFVCETVWWKLNLMSRPKETVHPGVKV